jgi:hypothetical protein
MSSSRVGRAALVLMFACAGAQAAGLALLPLAITLLLGTHDHAHQVSIVSEEGHLDLVFAHGERDGRHGADASPRGEPSSSLAEGDHVVHLTSERAQTSPSRRSDLAASCALAFVFALPFPTGRSARRPLPKARARGTDFSRLVVLRL